jgi:hypothetical protein
LLLFVLCSDVFLKQVQQFDFPAAQEGCRRNRRHSPLSSPDAGLHQRKERETLFCSSHCVALFSVRLTATNTPGPQKVRENEKTRNKELEKLKVVWEICWKSGNVFVVLY